MLYSTPTGSSFLRKAQDCCVAFGSRSPSSHYPLRRCLRNIYIDIQILLFALDLLNNKSCACSSYSLSRADAEPAKWSCSCGWSHVLRPGTYHYDFKHSLVWQGEPHVVSHLPLQTCFEEASGTRCCTTNATYDINRQSAWASSKVPLSSNSGWTEAACITLSSELVHAHICRSWTVSVTQVLLFAAPLSTILQAIRDRSSASFHLGLAVMGFVSSSMWTVYGSVRLHLAQLMHRCSSYTSC